MTDLILNRPNLHPITYTYIPGRKNKCVLYLHGWTAQRKSPKGQTVMKTALQNQCAYLSLDYTAHGESGGQPQDFTIGQGIADIMDIIQAVIPDMPLVVVGNSIGGWFGLWIAEQLRQVKGFVGLAPAPDITQVIWDKLLPDYAKVELNKGNILGPSSETHGFCFTQKLFEEARSYFMLHRPIKINQPIRLIIGDRDEQVEMDRVLQIKNCVTADDVTISLIKGANHHLSDPLSLSIIHQILEQLLKGK